MSSSIAIPKRRQKRPAHYPHHDLPDAQPHEGPSSPSPAGGYGSAATPAHLHGSSGGSSSSAAATPSSSYYGSSSGSSRSSSGADRSPGTSPRAGGGGHYRRPSLLSESMGRGEYTVVDVGTGENVRLITCVRASQGFEWNQEMFLPSYAQGYGASADLEHRADPIQDIVLTDEEIAAMLPS